MRRWFQRFGLFDLLDFLLLISGAIQERFNCVIRAR